MSSEIVRQESFRDSQCADFDAIYTRQKSRLGRTLDRIFRKDMYERFQFTIQKPKPAGDRPSAQ